MDHDIAAQIYDQTKYTVTDVVGNGGFGTVYRATSARRGEVAIKVARKIDGVSTLLNEARVMMHLHSCTRVAIPRIRRYGRIDPSHNYIAMDLLRETLKPVVNADEPSIRFIVHVRPIAVQLIDAFEAIHAAGFVYRDVKPSNFMMGVTPNHDRVYVVDFGMVKQYASVCKERSVAPAGTCEYMSVSTHDGVEQTPRDDMESIGYLMLYLLYGELPWAHAEPCEMKSLKLAMTGVIPNLSTYIEECRSLQFNDMPPYDRLRSIISRVDIF